LASEMVPVREMSETENVAFRAGSSKQGCVARIYQRRTFVPGEGRVEIRTRA
jgi:hypothetical protein